MEALFTGPLACKLVHLPRNRRQLRNPESSLSACVRSCLPSWSSSNTMKRPREHEVQPSCLVSYQYSSLHKNNRNFVKGICSLLLIACPLLWPVCVALACQAFLTLMIFPCSSNLLSSQAKACKPLTLVYR